MSKDKKKHDEIYRLIKEEEVAGRGHWSCSSLKCNWTGEPCLIIQEEMKAEGIH